MENIWVVIYLLPIEVSENPMFVENMGHRKKNTGRRGDKGKKKIGQNLKMH
jgi:hypothetical protein